MTHYRIPSVVFDLELFSPDLFARSALLPSLGDLFVLTIIVFFIIHSFYMGFHFRQQDMKRVSLSSVLLFVVSGFPGHCHISSQCFRF